MCQSEYAYFLRQNCTVGERPQDFFLLPKAEDVARVSLPEGDFLQIGIQLRMSKRVPLSALTAYQEIGCSPSPLADIPP